MSKPKSFEEYVKHEYEKECFFTMDDIHDESTMWNWWWGELEGSSFGEEEYLQGKRL